MRKYFLITTNSHFRFGVMAIDEQEAKETAIKAIERHYDNKFKIESVKEISIYHVNSFR